MAKRKAKSGKLNSDRRRHLVGNVRTILKAGRSTYFRFEAACRHGLRSKLLLEGGWKWSDADEAAALVVALALRSIGAQRPTWAQGQPAYTEDGHAPIAFLNCGRCGIGLAEDRPMRGWHLRYCSPQCRNNAGQKRTGLVDETFRGAVVAIAATRQDKAVACTQCETRFVPIDSTPGAKFCSLSCAKTFHHALKRRYQPCEWCGTPFTPRNIVRSPRFCSKSCAAKGRMADRKNASATAFFCEAAE